MRQSAASYRFQRLRDEGGVARDKDMSEAFDTQAASCRQMRSAARAPHREGVRKDAGAEGEDSPGSGKAVHPHAVLAHVARQPEAKEARTVREGRGRVERPRVCYKR